jgi:hypothetical protein
MKKKTVIKVALLTMTLSSAPVIRPSHVSASDTQTQCGYMTNYDPETGACNFATCTVPKGASCSPDCDSNC